MPHSSKESASKSANPKPSMENVLELAVQAFDISTRNAIELSRRTGTPVIIWEDGQTKAITPDEAEQRLNAAIEKRRLAQSKLADES